jgi:hypothetical protein
VICARIQHHPSRADLLPDLCARLSPLPVEVIEHSSEPPSPWAGYALCLTDMPECSHLLVLQDDAVPVLNFVPAVRSVAARYPNTPVCLWVSKQPAGTASRARRAIQRGHIYAPVYPIGPFVPIVTMLWPRHKAEEFMEWTRSGVKLPGHPNPRSDDSVVAKWMKDTRQDLMLTVPSLVEHSDVPSVKGIRNAPTGWKALFLAEDAANYEW